MRCRWHVRAFSLSAMVTVVVAPICAWADDEERGFIEWQIAGTPEQQPPALRPPRPPPRLRRATLTIDVGALVSPVLQLTSELRVARKWSLALSTGYGARPLAPPRSATTRAWQAGIEPRYYFVGTFDEGFYLSWLTTFARSTGAPLGFETLQPPPGLATGAFVGGKFTSVPIATPDVGIGFVVPVATPYAEGAAPPVAVVGRFALGGSF